jgi:hypothetical protein
MTPEQLARLIEESAKTEAKILSRIYGYDTTNGKVRIIEKEAEVIRRVHIMLADLPYQSAVLTLKQLVEEFKVEKIRTRSNRAFDSRILGSLIRPIYAGLLPSSLGYYSTVTTYPTITTPDYFRRAHSALKRAKLL